MKSWIRFMRQHSDSYNVAIRLQFPHAPPFSAQFSVVGSGRSLKQCKNWSEIKFHAVSVCFNYAFIIDSCHLSTNQDMSIYYLHMRILWLLNRKVDKHGCVIYFCPSTKRESSLPRLDKPISVHERASAFRFICAKWSLGEFKIPERETGANDSQNIQSDRISIYHVIYIYP